MPDTYGVSVRDVREAIVIFVGLALILGVVYFRFPSEKLWPFVAVVLFIGLALALAVIRRRAVLPVDLLSRYTPFPLVLLLSPPNRRLAERFRLYVLPAASVVVRLARGGNGEAYRVIKLAREFFREELGGAENVDKVKNVLERMGLYKDVVTDEEDEEKKKERKDMLYSLASLIHWIFRYRNLVFHSPRTDADPVDSWLAFRVCMIYLRDKYPVSEVTVLVRCRKCSAIVERRVRQGEAKWLGAINAKCTRCGEDFEVTLTPKLIEEHLELLEKEGKAIVRG